MSTDQKKIKVALVYISVTAVFLVSIFTLIGLWYSEGYNKVLGAWKVESIQVKGKDITQNFDLLRVSFTDLENRVILPYHMELERPYPVRRNFWKYRRRKLFQGQVEIYETSQGFFDGTYEIEIIDHRRPQLMRLYSDSIEFYLREQYFSLNNPTIEMDFPSLYLSRIRMGVHGGTSYCLKI